MLDALKRMLGIGGKSAPTATPQPDMPAGQAGIAGSRHAYAHVDARIDAVFAEVRDAGELVLSRGAAAELLASPPDDRAYAYRPVLRQYDRLKQEMMERRRASSLEFDTVDRLLAALNRQKIDWSPAQLESLLTERADVVSPSRIRSWSIACAGSWRSRERLPTSTRPRPGLRSWQPR